MFSRSESNDKKRKNVIQFLVNKIGGQKGIINSLTEIPLIGHFFMLIIGISIPYWLIVLVFKILNIETLFSHSFEAFGTFLWNLILLKKLNINFSFVHIPFWLISLVLSIIFFASVYVNFKIF